MEIKPEIHRHETLKFPKNFLWGTATSAHQVEGNNRHNDWYLWEQQSGKVLELSGDCCDFYRLYESDFDLAASMHTNAFRLSIEWSRLEPHKGEWDNHEIEHYGNVLRALKSRGFTVMLTLHHFTNPIWFAEAGGWERREAINDFARFVEFVAEQFGQLVDYWVTFNEPLIYVTQGYVMGVWPPGKKNNLWRAWQVYHNLIYAHRRAYKVLHETAKKKGFKAQVGAANNIISLHAYRRHSFLDDLYIRLMDKIWNHYFIDKTRGYNDFIGVNYYVHQRVERGKTRVFGLFIDARMELRELSDMGWEVYPGGIFDALMDVKNYNLPIIITENGMATLNDDRRARYIVAYLKELYHAIASGVDVRGYFYWSLLDNWEWEKGYELKFGLVGVDRKTQRRESKPSARVYSIIAKENGIPHELLRFIGHEARIEEIVPEAEEKVTVIPTEE